MTRARYLCITRAFTKSFTGAERQLRMFRAGSFRDFRVVSSDSVIRAAFRCSSRERSAGRVVLQRE